jgi:hypothetical protein
MNLGIVTGLVELNIEELAYRLLFDECETTKCCGSGTDSCEDDIYAQAAMFSTEGVYAEQAEVDSVFALTRPW